MLHIKRGAQTDFVCLTTHVTIRRFYQSERFHFFCTPHIFLIFWSDTLGRGRFALPSAVVFSRAKLPGIRAEKKANYVGAASMENSWHWIWKLSCFEALISLYSVTEHNQKPALRLHGSCWKSNQKQKLKRKRKSAASSAHVILQEEHSFICLWRYIGLARVTLEALWMRAKLML